MGVNGQRHAPAALLPPGMVIGTPWIGGWVGLRAILDTDTRRKIVCLCRDSNPGRPVCSQSDRATPAPGGTPVLQNSLRYCVLFCSCLHLISCI
jgi:hypothetical protein